MDGSVEKKGKVCVTGGTGFLASWLIMRLLQHGYSVNTTVRSQPNSGSKRDISYLTNLPSASDRLHFFTADFENPDSFRPAIEGCIGVFHVAHPIDFQEQEPETITNKSVEAILGILEACRNSKTVKRVVYTSSTATVLFDQKDDQDVIDESSWTDVDFIRNSKAFGATYCVSKTITERVALEFAEKHCLDLVTVIPSWINGPFICPNLPGSVRSSLALFLGNENNIKYAEVTPFVHTDDVASAHIYLFEYPQAKGRYICSSVEITFDELCEFLSKRYPQFRQLSAESVYSRSDKANKPVSSEKLLGTGFRYKYGLEEMYDDAVRCCKERGFL